MQLNSVNMLTLDGQDDHEFNVWMRDPDASRDDNCLRNACGLYLLIV